MPYLSCPGCRNKLGSPIRSGVLADVRAGPQPLKETVEGLLTCGDAELYRVKAGR